MAEPLTQSRRGKFYPAGSSRGMRRPHSSPNPLAGVGMSLPRAAPFAPLGPLCEPCFVSPTDRLGLFLFYALPYPPPFFLGSWNALLTLPFPEGLRPCNLPGNWALAHLGWGRHLRDNPVPSV
ncbi:hypothetical protein P7K49_036633 [Saguinus oedipus]|uniref:Uncharacterized protein n=1 Tax=Saguinus oedipus TaxID=9490 RepID=A0ABQ9TKR7_SAGOE|nr:hypothetical protein P7K49_036633 [Saguinus oedipus]